MGDYFTSKNRENILIKSAKSIIVNNKKQCTQMLNYSFNESWMFKTGKILELYSKTDENFPYVSVIVMDTIGNTKAILGFSTFQGDLNDTIMPQKKSFIFETNQEEREYLQSVFYKKNNKVKFTAEEGQYELFYPYIKNGKCIVLHFSDYQSFGMYES